MAETDDTPNPIGEQEDRRCRGRPQLRPDDETRQIIYEAARHQFAESGYATTSMETVARHAGVSTKTLYRLVPNKAALFEGMVTDRLDRFLSEVNLRAIDCAEIDEALYAALLACTELALDPEAIALQRMILQETGKADLARTFYQNGMARNVAALRATVFGGLPLPSKRQVEARVRSCVALFLRGCQADTRR